MNFKRLLSLTVCLTLGGMAAAAERRPSPESVSIRSLLSDMTDLGGLAEFPTPAYTCRQFSSYDRASKSPTEDWFANNDRGMYLRVEERAGRKEFVMMDAAGPGALVRIWSANPGGVLRIYLDEAERPVLEASMQELLGGRYAGVPVPIAGEASRGWNLYLPIPYARHCKVTSDAGDFYYHVNYRTYAPGTAVVSLTAGELEALREDLGRVAAGLAAPSTLNPLPANASIRRFDSTLAPGASLVLGTSEGPAAIRQFTIDWPRTNDRDEPGLRAVVLTMTFDGVRTVEAPLGDFFGAAPGINAYESLPFSVAADGTMACRWVMPFRESAEVKVHNLGTAAAPVRGAMAVAPYSWSEATLHFHAKWRSEHDVFTEPKIDWNYLEVRGAGVFAGVAFGIDNPVKAWWGEGDEKIYVDGESFPSHFGTGTEDYYGYAWCSPDLFTHAYHNQPRCDGPANYGRTSVNRFHILDRIPFTRDFRFDMELWHWRPCRVNLAVIGYWYARARAKDNFAALTAADVAVRPLPEYASPKVKGAIEGENLRVIAKVGALGPQDWEGTSGERHLWWHGEQKPGDRLLLGFEVPQAGTYRVLGRFLKAVDYGIAQFAINGRNTIGPIDFYNDGVMVTDEIDLGTFRLEAGENRLSVTITGAHPKAVKSYMVGIDYLRLEPATPGR